MFQILLIYLRSKGIDVPQIGEKRPRPGTRVRQNKQQATSTTNNENSTSDENKNETKEEAEIIEEQEEEEEVKESWDAETSSEEEEEEAPEEAPSPAQPEAPKSESEGSDDGSDEESSEEDSDEDDDDDDENEDNVRISEALSKRKRAEDRVKVGSIEPFGWFLFVSCLYLLILGFISSYSRIVKKRMREIGIPTCCAPLSFAYWGTSTRVKRKF